ncbi:MAG: TRAP transporter small permease subunit, partial [Betaproteobacteria bacterium]
MNLLLTLSRGIDTLNERLGRMTMWLVLASVLISAVNAIVRKAFNIGSNAFLEIQWYLFAGVFSMKPPANKSHWMSRKAVEPMVQAGRTMAFTALISTDP